MFVLRSTIPRIIHRTHDHIRITFECKQFYCKRTKLDGQFKKQPAEPDPTNTDEINNDGLKSKDSSIADIAEEVRRNDEYLKQKRKEFEEQRDSIYQKSLMVQGQFEDVKVKNREQFVDMVKIFEGKSVHRRNHVEFIYAALKNMREFGVNSDIEVYKALIDVMPKGKFIPTNMFQQEFMHYPKQQQCIIDLLEQMEENGVIPDHEVGDMLVNVFGRRGHPVVKFWRMMYWMPKFKNLSPWLLPKPVPDDAYELAMLAVKQMCTVDSASIVSTWQTKDVESSIDDTWIVTGQSPDQQTLLRNHPKDLALKVEGPFLIWLRNRSISYFILRGNPVSDDLFRDDDDEDDVSDMPLPKFLHRFAPTAKKNKVALKQSIHQQDDGTVYAVCATGTSTKDSLLSWIRLLEKSNPILAKTPVLFKFISKVDDELPAVVT